MIRKRRNFIDVRYFALMSPWRIVKIELLTLLQLHLIGIIIFAINPSKNFTDTNTFLNLMCRKKSAAWESGLEGRFYDRSLVVTSLDRCVTTIIPIGGI